MMTESEEIELIASSRKEDVFEAAEILSAANIPYKTDVPAVEHRPSQVIGEMSGPKYFLSVLHQDYTSAWDALEQAYSKTSLPSDHYLHTSTNEELQEILDRPHEWSLFDIAHTKIIAKQRNMDLSGFHDRLQEVAKEQVDSKIANRRFVGWLFLAILLWIAFRAFVRNS